MDDFQVTMQRVHTAFHEKKAAQRDTKTKGSAEEEEKTTEKEDKIMDEPDSQEEKAQQSLAECDREIKQAMQIQRDIRSKLGGPQLQKQNSCEEPGFSEQTQDVLKQDLEDLIK